MPAPSASEVGGGVPRTELQELQLKAQEQTDEVSFFFYYYFIIVLGLLNLELLALKEYFPKM